MNTLKLVKYTGGELPIESSDIKIDIQSVDGGIEAITLTDASGKFIRIVKDGTYSDKLKILIEEPKEYVTVYDVKIKQADGGIVSYFNQTKDQVDNLTSYMDEGSYSILEREVEKGGENKVIDDFDGIPF